MLLGDLVVPAVVCAVGDRAGSYLQVKSGGADSATVDINGEAGSIGVGWRE